MKKILLICHLDKSKSSGQEAKTLDIIKSLRDAGHDVEIFNYGKMNLFQKLVLFKRKIKKVDTAILMPGGRKALSFYCSLLKRYLNKILIHYIVVGGWITDYYSEQKNNGTFKFLKKRT